MEGRPEDAARYLRQFIGDARQKRDSQGVTVGLAALIMLTLHVDRPADAESSARELLAVLRRSRNYVAYASDPVAETLVRVSVEDAEPVLSELERYLDESGGQMARPQLLRARALLFARRDALSEASEMLHASAALGANATRDARVGTNSCASRLRCARVR
jgi:hypothetical protein